MRRASYALCLVLLAVAPAAAQAPHDPARLFPREAPIDAPRTAGLVRLPLPPAVLEATRGDLSDLRIHDERGVERPFVVESSLPRRAPGRIYRVTPTDASRRVERGRSLRSHYRERFAIAPPPQPVRGRFRLRLGSSRADFVRDVRVSAVTDHSVEPIAEGTVFRLPGPLRERLAVELPRLPEGATLEVEVVGEGGYVEPTFDLVEVLGPVDPETLALPMVEVARARRGERTVVELARPPGLVPDRVRLVTATGHFARPVRVLDLSPGAAPAEIGRGTVFRVRELGASAVEVDVGRAAGERLRIEIDDGDSPPLEELRVEAVVRQPALIFEPGDGALTLRFGGGRARRPDYDVARLGATSLGERLAAAVLPEARLGALRDNPRFDDGPALRFAMRPGRAPEVARFTHVAPLTVAGAPEGLSRVRLSPSVLAAARPDLGDVRIVDVDTRQWPYLRGAVERAVVDARVSEPDVEARRSRYAIQLDVDRATIDRVVLHTDAPYVARDFTLYGHHEDGRWRITSGRLTREPRDPQPLVLELPPTRARSLELVVEDGGDAPLEIEGATVSIPSTTLFLAAPEGDYAVLVGDPEAEAPSYEIARARELVLAVRAGEATVGPAVDNPDHVAPSALETGRWQTWAVWIVILFAMLALGLVTLRVVRQGAPVEEGEGDDEGAPPDDDGPPIRF